MSRRLAAIPAGDWESRPLKVDSDDRRYPHLMPQVVWTHHDGAVDLDFIGQFERLDDDWRVVADRLDLPNELGHHRACASPVPRHTAGVLARRGARCGRPEAFGYSF